MATPPPSDEELIERIKRRDSWALEELYDRYSRLAMGVAYRVLEDQEMAEDALLEAFLSVWGTAGAFDGHMGAGRAWVLGNSPPPGHRHCPEEGGPLDFPRRRP